MLEMKAKQVVVLEGEIWLPGGKKILDGRLVIVEGIIEEVGSKENISLEKYIKEYFNLFIREYMKGEKILPGFIEPHCHLGAYEEITGEDRLNEEDSLIALDYKIIKQINFEDIGFKEALFSGGVTTAAIFPGSGSLIGGVGAIVKTGGRQRVLKEEYGLKLSLGENVEKPFKLNREELKDILFKEFLNGDNIYIEKALKKEMPLRCHSHLKEDIEVFLDLKSKYDLEMIIEHGTEAFKLLEKIKKSKTAVVAGPFFVGRPKEEMADFDRKLIVKLLELGIPAALMTDYPSNPPEMLKYTIIEAVKNGVSEASSLDLITVESAKVLGIYDRVGSLEVGKDGDVVVHSHSPFDIKDQIVEVYIKGDLVSWKNL